MSHTIRIDADVYKALQQRAIAFVDTPNSVLRRILDLGEDGAREDADHSDQTEGTDAVPVGEVVEKAPQKRIKKATGHHARKRKRASSDSLLPSSEYELPLLATLDELGGSAPAREVIAGLDEKLDGAFMEADRDRIKSGAVRWVNRAQFVRFELVKAGDLVGDTPRGVWEISAQGRRRLQEATP